MTSITTSSPQCNTISLTNGYLHRYQLLIISLTIFLHLLIFLDTSIFSSNQMSSKREIIFRRCEVPSKDGKQISLEQKSVTEIFQFGTQPYIIVGTSGGGKTTLCLDLIYKLGKECTNIYYVTATKDTMKDDSISQIPRAYRRTPTFENLDNIWREVRRSYDAYSPNDDTLKKVFVEVCKLANRNSADILTKLNTRRTQIMSAQQEYYRSQKIQQSDCMKMANDDSKAFYVDTLSKLIVSFSGDIDQSRLSSTSNAILNALVSTPPKTLLILDDVSSEMSSLKSTQRKVQFNGTLQKISDAYKNLLLDILTKGRHFNAIICLFLHTIDLVPDKSLINNLIIMTNGACQKVCIAKTFSDETKNILQAVAPVVFTPDHKYCFFHINQLEGNVGVCRADLHYGEKLELSPMNQAYVSAVDNIYSGMDATFGNDKDDEDEYEEEEEDADNASKGADELSQFTIE